MGNKKETTVKIRKKTGKFIEYQYLRERSVTTSESVEGSPYWAWVKAHTSMDESENHAEPPTANPDELGISDTRFESSSRWERIQKGIQSLSVNQRIILELLVSGLSQKEIALELNTKQQSISRSVKAIKEKLVFYVTNDVV